MESLPLGLQFKSECYKRYLINNPDLVQEFAIAYFEQYLVLEEKYRKLADQNRMLKSVLMKVHRDSLPQFIQNILSEPEDDSQANKLFHS